jgi:3-deoxy-manno-octulosonate cytidylyltransferase (CMP-KDO synthetase)
MNAIGVIPARWGSTRFPGKPLALIDGKPLLQHVIEGAKQSKKLREIFVATDDERIANIALDCKVRPVMTDAELPTGTDRVWQAARWLEAEVILNIQGDEPLITGELLDRLVTPFESDAGLEMATLGRALDEESLQSQNTAKIVLNHKGEAIYFSRFPIPYSRVKSDGAVSGAMKHIGIYAYRREFLERYCAQLPTVLEQLEGLEQLRALFMGARIKVVPVEHDSWGVDTPEDVKKIEAIIRQQRTTKGPGR